MAMHLFTATEKLPLDWCSLVDKSLSILGRVHMDFGFLSMNVYGEPDGLRDDKNAN